MSSITFPSSSKIAIYLSRDWRVENEKEEFDIFSGEFIRNDGMKIFFRANHYGFRDKIVFSFSRPRDDKGNYVELYNEKGKISDPSITCSLSKTEDKMAQDILRRLLPEAERIFALTNEKIEKLNEVENNRISLLRQMAGAAQVEMPTDDRHGNQPFFFCFGKNQSHKVEINYSSVDISLRNLPPHRAERIIRFLRSMDEE